MNQPDNHIDELDEILKSMIDDVTNSSGGDWVDAEGMKRIETAKQQLDQYYADFYRNKIPEKLAYQKTDSEDFSAGEEYGRVDGWNDCVDTITAQFNRGGGG